jgi:uncharacterized DUF497 family protein
MEFTGFDWDGGNSAKCLKHGVSLEAIEWLFQRGVVVLPDDAHSRRERRFRAIGRTAEGRAIFVVFTLRRRGAATFIRPISARYMHAKEVKRYAEIYETQEAPDLED